MKNLVSKVKNFFNSETGKWALFIAASIIAGFITHKVIEKTSKE